MNVEEKIRFIIESTTKQHYRIVEDYGSTESYFRHEDDLIVATTERICKVLDFENNKGKE